MKEIIRKAKKILIAVEEAADFDAICASICLSKSLHNSDKEVSLLLPETKYAQNVIKKIPTQDLKLILKDEPESFILSLIKDNAIVKDVKWKEENGNINIYLTTEKGDLKNSQISVKPNYALFDLIIFIGVSDKNKLGRFYHDNPKAFTKNKILQIGNLNEKIGAFKFEDEDLSMSESVFKLINKTKLSADGEIFTDLLTGILWKTDGFHRIEDLTTAKTIADLVGQGANIKQASQKAFKNLTLQDTRLIQEILKNLSPTDGKVVYSIIHSANKKSLRPQEAISSSWPILDRLEKFNIAVILFQEQKSVFGVILSRNAQNSAIDIAKRFSPSGDRFFATFTSGLTVENIKGQLNLPGNEQEEGGKKEEKNKKAPLRGIIDPLAPAKDTPKPLDLENEPSQTQQSIKGGYTPPPPINPIDSSDS